MSKKRDYIINNLKLSPEITDVVMDFCRNLGTDKYAIWIAKEAKKNPTILEYEPIHKIIDWAQTTSPNILNLSFEEAFLKSVTWHDELERKSIKELANQLAIDESRIIYRCKDGKHFFYRLKPSELKMEGRLMGHCIGSNGVYSTRLRKKEIDIISIRDEKNYPHVTIELERKTGVSRQISGKGNKAPIDSYDKLITEYALFMSDDDDINTLIELMNI